MATQTRLKILIRWFMKSWRPALNYLASQRLQVTARFTKPGFGR